MILLHGESAKSHIEFSARVPGRPPAYLPPSPHLLALDVVDGPGGSALGLPELYLLTTGVAGCRSRIVSRLGPRRARWHQHECRDWRAHPVQLEECCPRQRAARGVCGLLRRCPFAERDLAAIRVAVGLVGDIEALV